MWSKSFYLYLCSLLADVPRVGRATIPSLVIVSCHVHHWARGTLLALQCNDDVSPLFRKSALFRIPSDVETAGRNPTPLLTYSNLFSHVTHAHAAPSQLPATASGLVSRWGCIDSCNFDNAAFSSRLPAVNSVSGCQAPRTRCCDASSPRCIFTAAAYFFWSAKQLARLLTVSNER